MEMKLKELGHMIGDDKKLVKIYLPADESGEKETRLCDRKTFRRTTRDIKDRNVKDMVFLYDYIDVFIE